jgi:hypothetical protein
MNDTMDATSEAGTTYPSGEPEFPSPEFLIGFVWLNILFSV